MLIYIQIGMCDIEKIEKILSRLPAHRDGSGFRSVFEPSFYYLLNEPKQYADGFIKLVYEIGTGAKENFYQAVITPLKDSFCYVEVEEFYTKIDKNKAYGSRN